MERPEVRRVQSTGVYKHPGRRSDKGLVVTCGANGGLLEARVSIKAESQQALGREKRERERWECEGEREREEK